LRTPAPGGELIIGCKEEFDRVNNLSD
jgi:hypothetical protein